METHELLTELERKIELLDAEFRRLVKKIDEEYHRVAYVSTDNYDNSCKLRSPLRSLRMHENLSPIKRGFDTETDWSGTPGKPRPPTVAVPNLGHKDKGSLLRAEKGFCLKI